MQVEDLAGYQAADVQLRSGTWSSRKLKYVLSPCHERRKTTIRNKGESLSGVIGVKFVHREAVGD
jgi:hypothetical protein